MAVKVDYIGEDATSMFITYKGEMYRPFSRKGRFFTPNHNKWATVQLYNVCWLHIAVRKQGVDGNFAYNDEQYWLNQKLLGMGLD